MEIEFLQGQVRAFDSLILRDGQSEIYWTREGAFLQREQGEPRTLSLYELYQFMREAYRLQQSLETEVHP